MKYIKKFESVTNFMHHLKSYRCTITIQELNVVEIRIICNKIMEWFPDFSFQSDFSLVAKTDAKYLKLNIKDYKYIHVSRIYTFMEEEIGGDADFDIIDGKLVLLSNSKEEFIQSVEMCNQSNKYNI